MIRLANVCTHFDKKALFVVAVALAFCPHLQGQNAPACGAVLASYNSIPAYSNGVGVDQWTENDCDPNDTLPPYGAYGEQFQCTEYVKRYYGQALGVPGAKNWIGDAIDWSSTSWATPYGLTFFPNGGSVSPSANDILTFSDPVNGVGHVAIVTSVSSPTGSNPTVTFIEQNWSVTEGTALPSLSYAYSCSPSGCVYTVSDRYSYNSNGQIKATFQVQGWIRATSAVTTNPTPSISLFQPGSLLAGASAQTLTINGTGFITSSTVTFNGTARVTTYVSSTQITIPLSTADLQTADIYPVVVVNPGPGGGPSSAVNFSVDNPAPSVSSFSPSSLAAGAAAQTLTINGTGFVSNSSVTFNGIAHTVTFVNANQLTISLSATDIATPGSFPVVVTNPAPGGGPSTPANFSVTNGQVSGEWTWIGGSSAVNASGAYGTQGVPSTSNIPGARDSAASWIDSSGNFWLFGGNGIDSTGSSAWMNDLWKYAPSAGTWTWVSGSNTGNGGWPGVYGTQGVPSTSNVPGERISATSWTDSSGHLWLFGGEAVGPDWMNDLWKYNPSAGTWTWMSGSSNGGQGVLGVYGTQGVPSASNVPGSRESAASWIDANGHLWLFGGEFGCDSCGSYFGDLNDLWEYDPSSGTWNWVSGSDTANASGVYGTQGVPSASNVPGARSGAVSWIDQSGRLWLFGGQENNSLTVASYDILNDLWKYNPSAGTWTWMSGSSNAGQGVPGVYGTQGVSSASNVPGSRSGAISWIDSSGRLWLSGGWGTDATGTNGWLNDLWRYDPSAETWTWVSGSNTANASGVFGTQGVSSSSSVPGGRQSAVSWIDSSGGLWLFGGEIVGSSGSWEDFNDFWRYQP